MSLSLVGIFGINPVAGVEAPRAGDFISSEAQGSRARDRVLISPLNDATSSYVAGTVLGKATIGSKAAFAISVSPGGANVTCGTVVLSAGVKQGTYTGQCVVTGATALLQFEDPTGLPLPPITVGSAYSGGGLAFTLTDHGTHFAVGDEITITVGTASFALGGGDTGNPTCSAITVDPGVIGGAYNFTMTDPTHFSGVDPFGNALPAGTFGVAYHAGGIDFTITAGGAACIAGDTFAITTFTGSDLYAPLSASAFDGTQNVTGILIFQQYVGGSQAVPAAIISRAAEVKASLLAWPANATDDQVRNWTAQLAALGIQVRPTEV